MGTAKLEIAFGVDATAEPAGGAWVDVSAYLRAFNTSRGRQRELDQVEAGHAIFTLDNRDRRFDSEYAAGPYYPDVLPMAHIRFTEDDSAERIFRGYTDSWKQSWPAENDAECVLECTDAFKVLANFKLAKSQFEREIRLLAPRAWYRLGEPQDSRKVLDSGASLWHGAVIGSPQFDQPPMMLSAESGVTFPDTGDKITVPVAIAPSGANWTISFTMRRPKNGDTPTSSNGEAILQLTNDSSDINTWHLIDISWGNTGSGRLIATIQMGATGTFYQVSMPVGSSLWDDKPHRVAVKRTSNATLKIYVDGVESASAAAVSTAIGSGFIQATIGNYYTALATNYRGYLADVVVYNSAVSDADILTEAKWALLPLQLKRTDEAIQDALDDAAWPAGLTDLNAGATKLQSHALDERSILEYATALADTEDGALYVTRAGVLTFESRSSYNTTPLNASAITFGDGGGAEVPYLELELEPADERIYNHARVSRLGGVVQEVNDAASQTLYFKRTLERTELLCLTDDEALQHGNWLIGRFADPRTTVRKLTVSLADSRIDPDDVCTLELGQLVTVKRRPPGGGTITKTARIEGIEHEAARDPATWRVSFWLSGWDAAIDQPLIWDDGTYGDWNENQWGF